LISKLILFLRFA